MRRLVAIPVAIPVAIVILLPVLWSLFTAPAALLRARAIAEGRPSCIQVALPGSGRYRPAASWLDLTAWRMRSTRHRRYGHPNFHAVLFVARSDGRFDRHNWSYRSMGFRPIAGQGHAVLANTPDCTPN